MAVKRDTIKQQLDRIRKALPKRDLSTGQLYDGRLNRTKRHQKIVLYGLFVSDAGTFLIRPHIFESKKDARNAVEWNDWLSEKYGEILPNILSGMEDRTGKQWRLYRIIGWIAGDNTRLINSQTRTKRNKTKSKRRQNGRNSTRRR